MSHTKTNSKSQGPVFANSDQVNCDSSGHNSVSNAFSAVIFEKLKPVHTWNKDDLTKILLGGDDILISCGYSGCTLPSDIPQKVRIFREDTSIEKGLEKPGRILPGDSLNQPLTEAVRAALKSQPNSSFTLGEEYKTWTVHCHFSSQARNIFCLTLTRMLSEEVKVAGVLCQNSTQDKCLRHALEIGRQLTSNMFVAVSVHIVIQQTSTCMEMRQISGDRKEKYPDELVPGVHFQVEDKDKTEEESLSDFTEGTEISSEKRKTQCKQTTWKLYMQKYRQNLSPEKRQSQKEKNKFHMQEVRKEKK